VVFEGVNNRATGLRRLVRFARAHGVAVVEVTSALPAPTPALARDGAHLRVSFSIGDATTPRAFLPGGGGGSGSGDSGSGGGGSGGGVVLVPRAHHGDGDAAEAAAAAEAMRRTLLRRRRAGIGLRLSGLDAAVALARLHRLHRLVGQPDRQAAAATRAARLREVWRRFAEGLRGSPNSRLLPPPLDESDKAIPEEIEVDVEAGVAAGAVLKNCSGPQKRWSDEPVSTAEPLIDSAWVPSVLDLFVEVGAEQAAPRMARPGRPRSVTSAAEAMGSAEEPAATRDALVAWLRLHLVDARPAPKILSRVDSEQREFHEAQRASAGGLVLPLDSGFSDGHIDMICALIRMFFDFTKSASKAYIFH
jgi:hypothetical protein